MIIYHFAKYDASGRYTQGGSTNNESILSQPNTYISDGPVPIHSHYHDTVNNVPVAMPSKPDDDHVFDWPSKTWVVDLARAKSRKLLELKGARDVAEYGGFEYAGHRYDSDPASQQRITGAVVMAMLAAQASQPFSKEWTLADNTTIVLDGPTMINVGLALGAHVTAKHETKKALKAQVDAAVDLATVQAVAWPTN